MWCYRRSSSPTGPLPKKQIMIEIETKSRKKKKDYRSEISGRKEEGKWEEDLEGKKFKEEESLY